MAILFAISAYIYIYCPRRYIKKRSTEEEEDPLSSDDIFSLCASSLLLPLPAEISCDMVWNACDPFLVHIQDDLFS